MRAAAAPFLMFLSLSAAAAGDAVLTPSPFPSERPRLRQTTVFSRREVVMNWDAVFSPARRMEVAARSLSSNLTMPALGGRVRYSYHEAEGEAKVLLKDGRSRGVPSLAGTLYLNRYWLQARDGSGLSQSGRKTFFGGKLLAGGSRGPWDWGAALRAMRGKEERRTTSTLGPTLRRRMPGGTALVAEVHPFLKNPLGYNVPWGWGLQWEPGGPLSAAVHMSNAYGTTTPDTFAGAAFAQYHLSVTARF